MKKALYVIVIMILIIAFCVSAFLVARYVLTGETAERFVREAEENERNPQRKALRMSFDDVEKILIRSTANLKAHGGKSPFAK